MIDVGKEFIYDFTLMIHVQFCWQFRCIITVELSLLESDVQVSGFDLQEMVILKLDQLYNWCSNEYSQDLTYFEMVNEQIR